MTKGGARAVTTRNTERGLADNPETTISPPGQTMVSRWTLVPEISPTRRHLVSPDLFTASPLRGPGRPSDADEVSALSCCWY